MEPGFLVNAYIIKSGNEIKGPGQHKNLSMKKVVLIFGVVGGALIGWKFRPRTPSFERTLRAQQGGAESNCHLNEESLRGQGCATAFVAKTHAMRQWTGACVT